MNLFAEDVIAPLLGASFVMALVALFAWILIADGKELGHEEERRKAIKAGVAHWTGDPITGESKFEYEAGRGTP